MASPKYLDYERDIHRSGQYLLDVINDILDMSKIEAGRLMLEVSTFDLPGVVEDVFRIVSDRALQGGVRLERQIPDRFPVYADKRALKQILINIIANGVKFTPEGGSVTVRALDTAEGVVISIIDTGIGIASTELPKLGRPFEQVENQFTKTKSGSGLGLAISKSLTEMHGGRLVIESALGEGTMVTVTLPHRSEKLAGKPQTA
jgi:two-component system cell cycle sensor histidine kinase PleC